MTTTFDLANDAIPSFASLQDARVQVFSTRQSKESLIDAVSNLPADGETGRRKGLGMWILGRYQEAVELLPEHIADDVASFTLAMSYMEVQRWEDALPIFQRLSDAYPEEPRPRAGAMEARLEIHLARR